MTKFTKLAIKMSFSVLFIIILIPTLGIISVQYYCHMQVGQSEPIISTQKQIENSEKLVFLIPGALSSVNIFEKVDEWIQHGYGIVYYRFPGMDGRELDNCVDVDRASEVILKFANAHPGKPIYLVGYSLGAQIAWAASQRLSRRVKRIAILSAGTGPFDYAALGIHAIGELSVVIRKQRKTGIDELLDDYFNVLLYGKDWQRNALYKSRPGFNLTKHRGQITPPSPALLISHAGRMMIRDPFPGRQENKTPTRFFHGSVDPVFSIEQVRDLVADTPSSDLHTLENHGHLIFATSSDLFTKIRRFFDQQ